MGRGVGGRSTPAPNGVFNLGLYPSRSAESQSFPALADAGFAGRRGAVHHLSSSEVPIGGSFANWLHVPMYPREGTVTLNMGLPCVRSRPRGVKHLPGPAGDEVPDLFSPSRHKREIRPRMPTYLQIRGLKSDAGGQRLHTRGKESYHRQQGMRRCSHECSAGGVLIKTR